MGEIVYIGGILLFGVVALASDHDSIPDTSYDVADAAYSPPPPNNDDDDDYNNDDYYDDDNNFGGRQKIGKNRGNAPASNKAQNEQTTSITKRYKLSYKKQELLHKYVNRQGYRYQEIIETLELLDGIK